jgi:hypothetical protein
MGRGGSPRALWDCALKSSAPAARISGTSSNRIADSSSGLTVAGSVEASGVFEARGAVELALCANGAVSTDAGLRPRVLLVEDDPGYPAVAAPLLCKASRCLDFEIAVLCLQRSFPTFVGLQKLPAQAINLISLVCLRECIRLITLV